MVKGFVVDHFCECFFHAKRQPGWWGGQNFVLFLNVSLDVSLDVLEVYERKKVVLWKEYVLKYVGKSRQKHKKIGIN